MKIFEIARTGYFKGLLTGDVVRFDLYPYGNELWAGMGGLISLYRRSPEAASI